MHTNEIQGIEPAFAKSAFSFAKSASVDRSTVAKASTSAKATADEMADRAERVLHKETKETKI